MIRVAIKGVLGRKLRAILTGFAIVLGVAMISGSFILTDTLTQSFNGVYKESYKATDAVVSSTKAIETDNGDTETPPFAGDVLQKIEALPSVRAALGTIEDEARLVGENGKPIGAADSGVAIAYAGSPADNQNPLRLVHGAWPATGDEIAIDRVTAAKHHLALGQTVGAYANGPAAKYRISGIVSFGKTGTVAGTTFMVFDYRTAERLFDKAGKLDAIRVGAKQGVSSDQLVGQIRPLLPADTGVQSSEAQAAADSKSSQDDMNVFKYFLLGFGGIALFVGSFVIANTLAITVAQRMRELATLRTLGASRRQVLGSVVMESVIVGIVGSAIGLFLGLGIAVGLMKILEATGIELPQESLVFAPRTIIVSLAVGTLIALLASLRPALKATRVEPISAVREGAVLPVSRFARFQLAAAGILGTVSIGLLAYGLFASGLEITVRLAALIFGVLFLFVGVAMVATRVVRPLAYVLGAPGARFGGTAGRLARQNAVRNPSRTASTAAAVMIGIALITFVAVIGQGFRSSFSESVNEMFVADYALTSSDKTADMPGEAVTALATAPGVEAISQIRSGDARLNGEKVALNGIDANMPKVLKITWANGSDSVPAKLGANGAVITKAYAEDHGLRVGSPLAVQTEAGKGLRLQVHGIIDEAKSGSPIGGVSVALETYDSVFSDHANAMVFINVEGGPSAAKTEALQSRLGDFPDSKVETRDEFKESQLKSLTMTLNILYLLLGLSVIVSLFGVVNTLVLSVFERTRELGMLRAIGMTRRQVRRMIRHESVVTALIGAALGIGVGIFLAAITTAALSQYGIAFSVPYGTLVIFVGVAIVAGMLAAILPARRASKLNVLAALQYE